jgi:hypothetical protein
MHQAHERVVFACRRIRRYAARGPGPPQGLFTFSFEIDALCDLKDYRAAWRQLRLRDRTLYGRRLDFARRQWLRHEGWELQFSYAPILFFLRKYEQGCALLEKALAWSFVDAPVRSYHVIFSVYNDDRVPSHRARVTLSHFYRRLSKRLTEWRYWTTFVDGFHSNLLDVAGVHRGKLLKDEGQLAVLYRRLLQLRDKRLTTPGGRGVGDLIDSAAEVKKTQKTRKKELERAAKKHKARTEQTNAKLRELFPELRALIK